MGLLTQNSKMAKAAVPTWNWTIPAFQSRTGLKTCPMAGSCAKGCYAQQGAYLWANVYPKHEANLELTRDSNRFKVAMISEITRLKYIGRGKARAPRKIAVRIHDSGDFYSAAYLMDWIGIINALPDVVFYAYTKMVPLFEKYKSILPVNLVIIYSEGGKADHLIDPLRHRHSRVFGSLEELKEAGYMDASKDDTVAWKSTSGKIGLVYHGASSKKWTTNNEENHYVNLN